MYIKTQQLIVNEQLEDGVEKFRGLERGNFWSVIIETILIYADIHNKI